LIRDRVVAGVRNDAARRTLLSHSNLTLKNAEDICREMEKTYEEAKTFKDTFTVNKGILPAATESILGQYELKNFGNGRPGNTGHENSDFTSIKHTNESNENYNPAKSPVKVVRRMITKCRESKNNILKGLQIIKNKPFHYGSIPDEFLTGKTTKGQPQKKYDGHDMTETSLQGTKSDVKLNMHENPTTETFKEKDPVFPQHYLTKKWPLYGSIETHLAPETYTAKSKDGQINKRNITDIRSAWLTHNTRENKRTTNDAISKIFNGNCHVTPHDVVKDHVMASTHERKISEDPDTFIEYDMSSDEVSESFPYDDTSPNDDTTISTSSSNNCNDELSDTLEYETEPDETGYDVRSDEVLDNGDDVEKGSDEYVYTTYM